MEDDIILTKLEIFVPQICLIQVTVFWGQAGSRIIVCKAKIAQHIEVFLIKLREILFV